MAHDDMYEQKGIDCIIKHDGKDHKGPLHEKVQHAQLPFQTTTRDELFLL